MQRLTSDDFANLFGTTVDRLPEECLKKIAQGDWSYQPLEPAQHDTVIVELLERIESRKLTVVADQDKSRWIKGWGENLDAFQQTAGSLDALVPKYIRSNQPVRLYKQFVRTATPDFELRWYEIFRRWFFHTELAGFETLFEFGCGSGFNVAELAQMYPQAHVTGLDWAQPSVDIIEQLRLRKGLNTTGRAFDFFHPDYSLEIPAGSAVFTIGALEQTGTNWGAFLDFLLAKKPARVFHIEPIYEWYDSGNLVDYTAIKAHASRNFWRGFPQRLIELETQGRVCIHRSKRAYFGSLVLEGYSQLVWSVV